MNDAEQVEQRVLARRTLLVAATATSTVWPTASAPAAAIRAAASGRGSGGVAVDRGDVGRQRRRAARQTRASSAAATAPPVSRAARRSRACAARRAGADAGARRLAAPGRCGAAQRQARAGPRRHLAHDARGHAHDERRARARRWSRPRRRRRTPPRRPRRPGRAPRRRRSGRRAAASRRAAARRARGGAIVSSLVVIAQGPTKTSSSTTLKRRDVDLRLDAHAVADRRRRCRRAEPRPMTVLGADRARSRTRPGRRRSRRRRCARRRRRSPARRSRRPSSMTSGVERRRAALAERGASVGGLPRIAPSWTTTPSPITTPSWTTTCAPKRTSSPTWAVGLSTRPGAAVIGHGGYPSDGRAAATPTQALRGAVLGLGMIGRHHARLLQASPRRRRSPAPSTPAATASAPSTTPRTCSPSLDELLAAGRLRDRRRADGRAHLDARARARRRAASHVLVEKPLAADGRARPSRLIDVVRAAGVRGRGRPRRALQPRAARAAPAPATELGEVLLDRAPSASGRSPTASRDVGVVKDLGDARPRPRALAGRGRRSRRSRRRPGTRMGRDHEDLVLVTGRLASGVSVQLHRRLALADEGAPHARPRRARHVRSPTR